MVADTNLAFTIGQRFDDELPRGLDRSKDSK